MRTVLLSKSDELYLEKCAQEHSFSYGIIVGHVSTSMLLLRPPPRRFILLTECSSFIYILPHLKFQQADLTKSIVVHLARNSEEDADLEDLTDVRLGISDINSHALASQWLSASKMCPGSFDVIGGH